MTLNDIPILPISEDPLKPSELTNLVVTQMPSDVDSIVYIINPKMFPTVSLSYGLLTRVETKNDIKNYELILNIYSVNQTEVNLKGLEMTVNEEPGTHKLSFGPYVSLPKGEMCGMNLKCMMDKMFRKVQDMRIPLPSFTSMGCHEEISEEETGTPSIELGKATTVTTPVFLIPSQCLTQTSKPLSSYRPADPSSRFRWHRRWYGCFSSRPRHRSHFRRHLETLLWSLIWRLSRTRLLWIFAP
jgi:hypothetical protein